LGTNIQYKLGNGSWQAGNQFTGLTAGTYTVYVKDLAEELSLSVTIPDPPPVSAAISGTTVLCNEASTTLTASGGVSYVWSNSLGTNNSVTVGQGNYTVTVTDINGCTATASASVTPSTGLMPVVSYMENSGVSR
jgi:ribosomal protein S5